MATIDYFVNANNGTTGNGLTRADNATYWAVSFDAGGSSAPVVDTDTVSFSTSGYTGTLRKVILRDGSWTGSDARGVLIFQDSTRSGSAPTNNETITIGSATALVNIGTANTFWSNTNSDAGAYTSFVVMEADQDGFTDRASDTIQIWFSGSNAGAGDDSTQVALSAWGSYTSLLLCGDNGTADGIAAYNGEGWNTTNDFSTSFYYLYNGSTTGAVTALQLSNITLRGLQLLHTATSGTAVTLRNVHYAATTNVAVENCWLISRYYHVMGSSNGSATSSGLRIDANVIRCEHENDYMTIFDTSPTTGTLTYSSVSNNIIEYQGSAVVVEALKVASTTTITDFYNNIFYGFTGFGVNLNNLGTISNYGTNATEDDQSDAEITVICTTTVNDDFVDGENGDLRPYSGGLLAGTGTAAKIIPATDITGATWTNDNIGPYNEIVGGNANISKIDGSSYSGFNKVAGVALSGVAKINGVAV